MRDAALARDYEAMNSIELTPIGIIHTPYTEPKGMPIQGHFRDDVEGWLELKEEYVPGLKDLDGFSHAILIYYFHRSKREEQQAVRFSKTGRGASSPSGVPTGPTTWGCQSSGCRGSRETGCTSQR
jgi:tRNA (Thr-GGU) A37 N-methylase